MKQLEPWLLTYLLNSLWQVPLLFAAGWIAARLLRRAGAPVEHRLWVSVLLLQTFLPVFALLPWGWLPALFTWSADAHYAGEAYVSVVMGAGTGFGALSLPSEVLTAIVVVYGAVIAYFAAQFVWRWAQLWTLRREALKMPLRSEVALCWAQCSVKFAVHGASIAFSSRIFGPVTVGFFRKLILLPAEIASELSDADLDAAIAHEFAHLRRNDFLKNLAYELLSLPIKYHPALGLTRERITETREMVCDQMAAEISGPTEYALSLLRLASVLVDGAPTITPHAIGILDANAFERRVMRLTGKQNEMPRFQRLALVFACAALGSGTCASAVALSMHVDPGPAPAARDTAPPHNPVNVSPEVVAGHKISGPIPKYPESAKKARIQGTVLFDAIIGKDGTVEQLTVASGPQELQQSALDAVRQWIYKPFLLNGSPVEVKTTIRVIYTLAK
jgi:TonB family protein